MYDINEILYLDYVNDIDTTIVINKQILDYKRIKIYYFKYFVYY